MKLTLTLLLTVLSFTAFSQRLRYLDINMQPVTYKKDAVFYTETTFKDRMALVGTVKTFFLDGTPLTEVNYSSLFAKKREGLTIFYYPNGKIKTEISFKNNLFDGPLKSYYPNQRIKRAELYDKGNFVTGKCFTPAGNDTAHYAFQTDPKFPGGQAALEQYIRKNLKKGYYLKDGHNPSALVHFYVKETGELSDSVFTACEYKYQSTALKQMVKGMPKWIPGTDDGIRAEKLVTIPISFSSEN